MIFRETSRGLFQCPRHTPCFFITRTCNRGDAYLKIKNRCTKEGENGEKLTSIPKFGPEIKNQCSRGVVAVCRRNHSPLPLRKLESDAENRCRKQHPPKSRHAQRSAATKTNTKNSIFVNPGLTLGRVPKMRSRKGI